jgi:homopolymeric O-antigen transport system permease protein
MRVLVLIAVDALIAVIAVFVAYRLRFDPSVLPVFLSGAERVAAVAAPLVPACFAIGRIYARPMGRLWPLRILIASGIAFTLSAAVLAFTTGFAGVSRFSFAAAALLTTLGAAGWRSIARIRDLMRPEALRATQEFDDLAEPDRSIGLNLLKLWAYRELVRNLVLKDLKLKYRGSALGFIWSLVNPLLMLAVYSLAFTYIMKMTREGFVYFLLLGILAWTFFGTTTAMATGSITDASGLLRSVRFPRTVLPVATVLFNLAQYLLTFAVLLPAMLIVFGVAPAASMLAFPGVLFLLVLFTTGVAFMVAAAAAFFRDIKHFVEVALAALFWMTPILYDLSDVPDFLRLPILLMPLSPFITMLHDIFYYRVWPDGSIWAAGVSWASAAFIGGVSVFLSFEDRFAENV